MDFNRIIGRVAHAEMVGMRKAGIKIGGTWHLPKNKIEYLKTKLILKRLKEDEDPPEDFYHELFNLVGDDQLFDRIDKAQKVYYESVFESVMERIKEFAKDDPSSFKNPEQLTWLKQLAIDFQ